MEPAIERAEAGPLPVWLAPAAGLVLGAVGLLRLEEVAGRLMHGGGREHGRMGRVVLAVTLHNLPEGMVVGLAAALALRGEPEAVSGALALALGIGLQNIPEGAAVSLPLAQAGQGRRKAFCAGAASGLVEPLGALLALALLASPYLLAAWRIALYGGQTDQGALIVIIILIVYGKDMCHEWLETRRERQGEKEQAERHDGGGDRPARRRKRNKALRGRNH